MLDKISKPVQIAIIAGIAFLLLVILLYAFSGDSDVDALIERKPDPVESISSKKTPPSALPGLAVQSEVVSGVGAASIPASSQSVTVKPDNVTPQNHNLSTPPIPAPKDDAIPVTSSTVLFPAGEVIPVAKEKVSDAKNTHPTDSAANAEQAAGQPGKLSSSFNEITNASGEMEKLEILLNVEAKRVEYLKNKRQRLAIEEKINKGIYDDAAVNSSATAKPDPFQMANLPLNFPINAPRNGVNEIKADANKDSGAKPGEGDKQNSEKLAEAKNKSDIVLKSVDSTGDKLTATLLVENARRTFGIGDYVGLWKILEIYPEYIKMVKGSQVRILDYK
jgi:hypothetical protein